MSGYDYPPLTRRIRDHARSEGTPAVARRAGGWAARYAAGLVHKPRRTFTLGGETYEALHDRHGWTWLNERAVELPVAKRALDSRAGARVLEVGNVLSHYWACDHEVADKYERAPRVRNVDVLDLERGEGYDLILSVSTIEHVGVDDEPRDPARALEALHHLRGLLRAGGRLLVTVPAGYNRELDAALLKRRGEPLRLLGLERVSNDNRWVEVAPERALSRPYDFLIYCANGLVVGEWSGAA